MKREEIKERMDELGRKFDQTRDKKIAGELYELARDLEKIKKESLDEKPKPCAVVKPGDMPSP